jgi:hypothetical protein
MERDFLFYFSNQERKEFEYNLCTRLQAFFLVSLAAGKLVSVGISMPVGNSIGAIDSRLSRGLLFADLHLL